MEHFPLFGVDQGSPKDELIEIDEFALPHKWQKQIIVQVFESSDKNLIYLIEL